MAGAKPGKFTYDYPRPALTADVVLVTREADPRVLLIKRKSDPFAGLWALPGGFVDEGERPADAARRELQEEAGLTVEDLEPLYTAGDPGRDPRGVDGQRRVPGPHRPEEGQGARPGTTPPRSAGSR
ncbi:MAG: NUDIX hydrolase [Gemmataceae bacterium]